MVQNMMLLQKQLEKQPTKISSNSATTAERKGISVDTSESGHSLLMPKPETWNHKGGLQQLESLASLKSIHNDSKEVQVSPVVPPPTDHEFNS